jgi:hypothetical protein
MVGTRLGRSGDTWLHLTYTEGGFGVKFDDVTKDAVPPVSVWCSRRRPTLLFSRFPGFMKPTPDICGERTTPTCPPSLLNTGWPYRSLNTGSPSKTPNLCLWSRVVLNRSSFTWNRALPLLMRILCFGLRWPVLSLRKRMTLDVSYTSSRWVGLDRSGLITVFDKVCSVNLGQTFFDTSVGSQIPLLPDMTPSDCGCRKFQMDALGHHLCTRQVVPPPIGDIELVVYLAPCDGTSVLCWMSTSSTKDLEGDLTLMDRRTPPLLPWFRWVIKSVCCWHNTSIPCWL